MSELVPYTSLGGGGILESCRLSLIKCPNLCFHFFDRDLVKIETKIFQKKLRISLYLSGKSILELLDLYGSLYLLYFTAVLVILLSDFCPYTQLASWQRHHNIRKVKKRRFLLPMHAVSVIHLQLSVSQNSYEKLGIPDQRSKWFLQDGLKNLIISFWILFTLSISLQIFFLQRKTKNIVVEGDNELSFNIGLHESRNSF